MDKKVLLFGVAWLCSLAMMFGLGRSSKTTSVLNIEGKTDTRTVLVERSQPNWSGEATAAVDGASAPDGSGDTVIAGNTSNPGQRVNGVSQSGTVPPEMFSEWIEGMKDKDSLKRNLAMAQLLTNLSPGNVRDALKAAEGMPVGQPGADRERHDVDFRSFISAWAGLPGQGEDAARYIWENKGKSVPFAGHEALKKWAADSPNQAINYVNNHPDPKEAKEMLFGVIEGWMENDLEEAARQSAELPAGPRKNMTLVKIAEKWVDDRGVADALEYAHRTQLEFEATDPAHVSDTFKAVFAKAGSRNSASFAAWIDENPEHPHLGPLQVGTTARQWLREDPQAAQEWLEKKVTAGQAGPSALNNFAHGWARIDASRAADFISQHPEELLSDHRLLGTVGNIWAREEPVKATHWIAKIPDEALQQRVIGGVMAAWPYERIEEAKDWTMSETDSALLNGARSSLAARLRNSDPQSAMQIAAKITNPKQRQSAMISSARAMRTENPQAVEAWLPVSGIDKSLWKFILIEHQFEDQRR